MARFMFISWSQWGHIDLGGMSLHRTGVELCRRGHKVFWVFADKQPNLSVLDYITQSGIQCIHQPLGKLVLSGVTRDREAITYAISVVGKLITKLEIDALVADRTIALAGLLAEFAGVPYASVGTDASPWCRRKTSHGKPYVTPGKKSEFISEEVWSWLNLAEKFDPQLSSDWLISPYLNISFFPKLFFEPNNEVRVDVPVHYLGSGKRRESGSSQNKLILTLGNTFDPNAISVTCDLLNQLSYEIVNLDAELKSIICLTGSEGRTRELRDKFGNKCFEFVSWMEYSHIFSESRVAIGHGGNAFTWECMRSITPSVIVAPHVSDQFYNSNRICELGIGVRIDQADMNKVKFKEAIINALIGDSMKKNLSAIHGTMCSGGGVTAGASLLEILVEHQRPVTECLEGSCCC